MSWDSCSCALELVLQLLLHGEVYHVSFLRRAGGVFYHGGQRVRTRRKRWRSQRHGFGITSICFGRALRPGRFPIG